MPIITDLKIQEKNKERCNLFVDGTFFSGISLETVIKFHLKKDLEISRDELDNVILEAERLRAFDKALEYVSKLSKTKRQVKDYLIKKGFSEDISWQAIDKLKEYGYIDDIDYARRFIEYNSKKQGIKLLQYKLMQKGIKKEDIEKACSDIDVPFKENATLIAQKYMKNKEKTRENIAKAYRYLVGKGFSYDEIEYALSDFNGEN